MGFNLLVVVLFTATDYSLVSTHCPDHKGCTPLELQGWDAAQVSQPASDSSAGGGSTGGRLVGSQRQS